MPCRVADLHGCAFSRCISWHPQSQLHFGGDESSPFSIVKEQFRFMFRQRPADGLNLRQLKFNVKHDLKKT
jgi:hypothetical protein